MWNFLSRMNPRILIIVQVSQWNGFLRGIFKIMQWILEEQIRCVEIDTSLIFRVQFTCSNVLVSFLQFPCHCIWSIVQIILSVVISCILIFFLLIDFKKKRKITYHTLYWKYCTKLHKICKRYIYIYISSIMYRNWYLLSNSYFVFLLLNCIKKVRANSIPKNYHRNVWCVCRIYHLLIL